MQTGFKFRAYLTSQQKLTFARWAGCARVVYNLKCAERKAGVVASQAYAHFKTDERAYLNECPPEILRNSAANWFTALVRFRKGLAEAPRKQKKSNCASVTLTRELFSFVREKGGWSLCLGKNGYRFGQLSVAFDREFPLPNQITLSRKNGHYYLSFSTQTTGETDEAALRAKLMQLSEVELLAQAWGGDRGVKQILADSEGAFYHYTKEQEKKFAQLEATYQHNQKRLARQKRVSKQQAKAQKQPWERSKRQEKTRRKIAEAHHKAANIRNDFAHQTTALLVLLPFLIYFLEDLKIKNMTARPKAKQDTIGKWLPNGRRAKAGLNKSILASCWGRIALYLTYKTLRAGKVTLRIPAPNTSRECSRCGHIAPANRKTQAVFACQSCGHTEQADTNAGKVIKQRGMRLFLAGQLNPKPRKNLTRRTRGRARGAEVRPITAQAVAGTS